MTLALTYDVTIAGIIFLVALIFFFIAAYIFGKANLPMLLVAFGLGLCGVVWAWQQFAAS